MSYGIETFVEDCRAAIDRNTGTPDLDAVRRALEQLLANASFVQEHCGPNVGEGVRELHRDADFGFLLLAHVYSKSHTSPPHDHGASWAVYGQAVGWTDMTEYDRLDDGAQPGKADIQRVRSYRLSPGEAGHFGPHRIHHIHFSDGARFLRVTGTDLTGIETLRYDMAAHTVHKSERRGPSGSVEV